MNSHEVFFENKAAGITLAGTLTIPQSQKPVSAVLLISGMGPNDRDYTMFSGHKLFAVLAEHLVQQGIAAFRYDKRGVGKSTGKFDTTVTSKDLAGDVRVGVEYLKTRSEIDPKKIGLIGHSEGGVIALMMSAELPDIAFVVSMGGAVATGIDAVVEHVALQLRADGATEQFITLDGPMHRQVLTIAAHEADYEQAEKQMHDVIADYWEKLPEAQKIEAEKLLFAINASNADESIKMFNSPWYRYYLSLDVGALLARVTTPVLALAGDLDFIAAPKIIAPIIEKGLKLAGNKDYTIVEFPKLNHWFQTCKTGALAEYGATKETIAPVALNTISEWIAARV